MDLPEQIIIELGKGLSPWEALLGPEMFGDARRRIYALAPIWAGQLHQDDDERLAAQTVIDMMAVLGDRDDAWYGQTPLGRAMARSTGGFLSESVSFSAAAAMLGVSRTRIAQWIESGRLDRHAEGGISTASVIALATERAG